MNGYIPAQKKYEFNELHVRSELAYYEVVQRDEQLLLEALSRIGAIPYVTSDGKTRLFKINVHDGGFRATTIGNIEE